MRSRASTRPPSSSPPRKPSCELRAASCGSSSHSCRRRHQLHPRCPANGRFMPRAVRRRLQPRFEQCQAARIAFVARGPWVRAQGSRRHVHASPPARHADHAHHYCKRLLGTDLPEMRLDSGEVDRASSSGWALVPLQSLLHSTPPRRHLSVFVATTRRDPVGSIHPSSSETVSV